MNREEQLLQELQLAEARYNAVVEGQTELIVRFWPDGRISFVNEAFCRVFALSRESLLGARIFTLLYQEDGLRLRNLLTLLQRPGSPNYIETRTAPDITPDLWLGWHVRAITDKHGMLREYQACGQDISAIKNSETRVKHSEERYQLLVEQASDGIFATDYDGRIVDVNHCGCVMLGYARQEMLQLKITELAASPSAMQTDISRLLTGETVIAEYQLRRRDGSLLPVEISANALSDGRLQAIVRDISTRKQLEQEIIRLDRLNMVGEIAVGIAHEIRNPLTTIKGYSQMLVQRTDLARHAETFQLILSEVDNANTIITEFLSLANNKRMELKSRNLNLIIRSLIRLIAADPAAYHKHLKLELADLPLRQLDEEDIRQLIINLVRNGLESMSAGGTLTIRTFMEKAEIVLAIEDQGTGIPTDLFDKLGTPFFTTKPEGTGLGLAVCYSIANRHNGYVRFTTGPKGTTFFVRFRAS